MSKEIKEEIVFFNTLLVIEILIFFLSVYHYDKFGKYAIILVFTTIGALSSHTIMQLKKNIEKL